MKLYKSIILFSVSITHHTSNYQFALLSIRLVSEQISDVHFSKFVI